MLFKKRDVFPNPGLVLTLLLCKIWALSYNLLTGILVPDNPVSLWLLPSQPLGIIHGSQSSECTSPASSHVITCISPLTLSGRYRKLLPSEPTSRQVVESKLDSPELGYRSHFQASPAGGKWGEVTLGSCPFLLPLTLLPFTAPSQYSTTWLNAISPKQPPVMPYYKSGPLVLASYDFSFIVLKKLGTAHLFMWLFPWFSFPSSQSPPQERGLCLLQEPSVWRRATHGGSQCIFVKWYKENPGEHKHSLSLWLTFCPYLRRTMKIRVTLIPGRAQKSLNFQQMRLRE